MLLLSITGIPSPLLGILMVVLTNHEEKAPFIWHSFKERLGISEFSGMNIDLATLITLARTLIGFMVSFSKMRLTKLMLISPTISPQVLMALMENS
jgi:hypothetical protein